MTNPKTSDRSNVRGQLLRRLRVVGVALAGLLGLVAVPAAAHGASRTTPAIHVASYDLGDRAFVVPGLLSGKKRNGPMELTGWVYYPASLGHGRHPLVVIMHGYWITCADRQSQTIYDDPDSDEAQVRRAAHLLNQWPCAKGIHALPSYLGYGYLERALARRGNVVVSVGANGANAIDSYEFQGDEARIALIAKHLRMWQQFADRGQGPLARVLPTRLVHHVDLRNVGLVGHSRGGRAVLQYASDAYRTRWPKGVTIRSVLGLAPAGGDPSVDYQDTTTAVGLLYGNCDDIARQASEYYPVSAPSSKPVYRWQVSGANHDFWNTYWSPSSGEVGAYDDAHSDPTRSGYCADTTDTSTDNTDTVHYVRQLDESRQRSYATVYIGDFFDRTLHGLRRHDSVLEGRRPLPGVVTTSND